MDVGPDFYAAQTFFRPNFPSEKLIQLAWNDHWNGGIGKTPWERNATFPVEVNLVTSDGLLQSWGADAAPCKHTPPGDPKSQ